MVRLAVFLTALSAVGAARIQVDTDAVELGLDAQIPEPNGSRRRSQIFSGNDFRELRNCGSVQRPPGYWCRSERNTWPNWMGPSEPAPNPFPNTVTIINAESGRRLYAYPVSRDLEGTARGVGADTHDSVWSNGHVDRWSIEHATDQEDLFTINNVDSGRSLRLLSLGTMESQEIQAYQRSAYNDIGGMEFLPGLALWRIEPTDDGKYTITNAVSANRIYANTQEGWENGFGPIWSGGPLWPDQTWTIEAAPQDE